MRLRASWSVEEGNAWPLLACHAWDNAAIVQSLRSRTKAPNAAWSLSLKRRALPGRGVGDKRP